MPDEDPFAQIADDSEYSPDGFYTASREPKGFSAAKRVHIPPNLAGTIDRIVGSTLIPEISTPPDFTRDAYVHNVYRIARIAKDRGEDHNFTQATLDAAEELRIETLTESRRARRERIALMIVSARETIAGSMDRERTRREFVEEFGLWPNPEERQLLLREFM